PDRVRGFPFAFAHEQEIVAGGAAPVDAARGLAVEEAAVLPEILAGPGAAAAMHAVIDGGRDAARLEHEPGHCRDQMRGLIGARLNFGGAVTHCGRVCHLYPSRAFRRPITPAMVSPSARAA